MSRDPAPFGDALIHRLWRKLMKEVEGQGLLYAHRDYCGHGLLRQGDGVALMEVEDGWGRSTLAAWTDLDAFVEFWARQSDFSCGGWDPAEPLFHAADEWARGNQRITRERLLEYLDV